MAEIGYVLYFLTISFILPYLLGSWFFNKLKKRWRILGKDKGPARFTNYAVFLLCALVAWLFEVLVLTGIKVLLEK
jgi:hypothetical protein